MEWVETTGRSVEEAMEAALDELGVDEADAEFEVLAEAQTGLFGRLRSEARVRARVRPTAPRSKDDRRDRRDRRRRSGSNPAPGAPGSSDASSSGDSVGGPDRTVVPDTAVSGTGVTGPGDTAPGRPRPAEEPASHSGRGPRRNRRQGSSRQTESSSSRPRRGELPGESEEEDLTPKGTDVDVDLDRQGQVAADFLKSLTAEFGLDTKVAVTRPDEETVELQLSGSDLGILIGPKGATLLALQSLTRTVVFNETGGSNGHINVDVGGYRQKRTEALVRFATQIADRVKETGARTALEPMSAVDRKVVHDTITGIEGVSTVSEGEEPRRRVVVLPG